MGLKENIDRLESLNRQAIQVGGSQDGDRRTASFPPLS